jgi:hypothetical protein
MGEPCSDWLWDAHCGQSGAGDFGESYGVAADSQLYSAAINVFWRDYGPCADYAVHGADRL